MPGPQVRETFLQDGGPQPHEVPVRRRNVLPLPPAGQCGHRLQSLLLKVKGWFMPPISVHGQECLLLSDDKLLMEQDVAKGDTDAKAEMDRELPEVTLKHDPTSGK